MASIDVDIDDIIWAMSSYEKQELADELYNEGYTPSKYTDDDGDVFQMIAETTTEDELKKVLENIWKNRIFINNNDLESLNFYANKGDYGN